MHAADVISALYELPLSEWALGVLLSISLLFLYRLYLHPLSRYPGPALAAVSSLWFQYWITKGRLPEECERLYEKYQTPVLRIGPNQIVFRTASSYKDVVGRHDVYKGPFSTRIFGFHSTNVSNIKDPVEHRRKRKLMNPGFSSVTLGKQEPTLIMPLVDKLVARVAETRGRTFDMASYFDSVTTDIIGKLSFGADFGMLDEPETHPFLHVLPRAFRASAIAQPFPEIYKLLDFLYYLGPDWLKPKSSRIVRDFSRKHLQARAERDEQGLDDEGEQHDIMSVIVNGGPGSEDDEERMSAQEMLGEAIVLVSAGGDTVATALTMAVWNLSRHPSIMRELQTQIRSTFEDYGSINSKDVASKVPLVDAVLDESMRLTPVLPGPMWRRSDADMIVDGSRVPAGTDVGIQRLALFTNSEYFTQPKQFKPERWLDKKGEDNLDAAKPFGIGPHTCPGRFLAMVEMRLIIAKLLWKFDWDFITKEYDNPDFAVVYRGPFQAKATARG